MDRPQNTPRESSEVRVPGTGEQKNAQERAREANAEALRRGERIATGAADRQESK